MEYEIIDPKDGPCRYSVTVGAHTVDGLTLEDYGVKVRRRADGAVAELRHLTASIPRIDAIIDRLMDEGVQPEGLSAAIARYMKSPMP